MQINNLDKKRMVLHKKSDKKINAYKKTAIEKSNEIKEKTSNSFTDIKKDTNKQLKIIKNVKKINNKSLPIKDIGINATVNNIEGGKEIKQSLIVANEISRPAKNLIKDGKKLVNGAITSKNQSKLNTKKIDVKNKTSKKRVRKTGKHFTKKTAKETSKKIIKKTTKTTAKKATEETIKATTKVAGTAFAGPAGFLIGVGINKKLDDIDRKKNRKNRMIKFLMDKTKDNDKQQDSIQKLVKDLVINYLKGILKSFIIAGSFLILFILMSLIIIFPPVVAIATVAVNFEDSLETENTDNANTLPHVKNVSSMTQKDIDELLKNIKNPMKKQVVSFALSKVGYPYSQKYRDSGRYYDCSSLAYYSWKSAGVDISYGGSTTAAAEGELLEITGKAVSYSEMQAGDLIFFSYMKNGRYRNISHVAVYVGNGKVVEAKSEKYGVVYGDVPNKKCIVLIGRPR